MQRLRVMVIDESREFAQVLSDGLSRSGHEVVSTLSSMRDLMGNVETCVPDVIIVSTDSPSRDSLEHICVVSRDRPRPIVMFSNDKETETIQAAVRAGVTAYVVDGLEAARIQAIVDVAVARFSEYQAMRNELAKTKSAMADRKSIDRAKGILMKQRQCDEDDAFQALRKLAMDRNIRLGEAAEQVINVAKMLR